MFKKFTALLDQKIQPLAVKMSQNIVIQSITHGMLGIISLTIGVSIVSILINLPFTEWTDLLKSIGVMKPANELISATTSMLAIYIVISVSYSYAKNVKEDPKATAILATAVFIVLMPQSITIGDQSVNALLSSNLGSNGIFVAIIVGILTAISYHWLIAHNIKIKMPPQVPPMVSEAMTPIIASMVIFCVTFLLKWGLSLTSYGDIYTLIYEFMTAPALAIFGTSVWTPVLYCVMRSIFWFFGIHPSPLNAIFFPISTACVAANVEAFMVGDELPYLAFTIMTSFGLIGGTGSTFALNLNMLKAKSERYKALSKVSLIPGLFNINEPLVFGVPIMYNPILLIPTVLAPILGAFVGMAFVALGLINSGNLNPSVSVAWVIPYPIAAFLRGGVFFMLAVFIAIVIQVLLYYPFFQLIDKQALQEEEAIASNLEEKTMLQ